MKTSRKLGLLAIGVLSTTLFVGCASVALPPAKGYAVQVGNQEYWAKSIKFHGDWIEMETAQGPVWAKSVVWIKPKIN